MKRIAKSEPEVKFVRVPGSLRRHIEEAILKSRTGRAECPFGHDVEIDIVMRYVPKGGPDLHVGMQIQRPKVPRRSRLVQSSESVTYEDFDGLLAAPFHPADKNFIRFFQKRKNKSASPLEWIKNGFCHMAHASKINSFCERHRIGIRFAETGEYDDGGASAPLRLKYQFYLIEKSRKARK